MTVQVGPFIIEGVHPGNDIATEMAVDVARAVASHETNYTHAAVHRFDGLVLTYGELESPHIPGSLRGWHFRSALCGYSGTGVHGAAKILQMFGFGTRELIYEQISSGGEDALYTFTK